MNPKPSLIETCIASSRIKFADAGEALCNASAHAEALSNAHDPVDQARALNDLRAQLLDAQKAIAEAIYVVGQIRLAKPGKVAA